MVSYFKEASDVKRHAYCPYSHFHVGAVVELRNGDIVKGVNVENTAYGSTICAERNALLHAITEGYKKNDIVSITITSDSENHTYPCGDCRQVMLELCKPDVVVHMFDRTGKKHVTMTVEELIPSQPK